jgi:thiol-disulfide isomerase/thioredoxin
MTYQQNAAKTVLAIILGLVLLLTGCQTSAVTQAPIPTTSTTPTATTIPTHTPTLTPTTATGSQVGNLAPDFTLLDLNGQAVSLSSLRGKPVLLNFWATWCSPCRQEMPYLQQINAEWASKGLVLLAIDIGESSAQVKTFLENNRLSLPTLLDSDRTVSTRLYNITAIPMTFFIDQSGIIQQKMVGSFPNKQAIEKYVSQIVP